jgi:hypothetical protein
MDKNFRAITMVEVAKAELNGQVVLPYHRALNAMGPRGVQLMRSLMSSNPLKQNSSGERMMLKTSCWPQIPGAVLAGLRALEL